MKKLKGFVGRRQRIVSVFSGSFEGSGKRNYSNEGVEPLQAI